MLTEYWYVAAASARLKREPLAARVLDRDVVVYRDGAGHPAALLDRCVHRGVRLSLGRVEAGHLECPYHGWRYGGDGGCVKIPSLTPGQPIPAGIGVPSFPCVEQDGYVWVWMGQGDPHPERPIRIPEFDDHRWLQASSTMDCPGMKGIENNIDPCHAGYTHRWTHPQFYRRRFRGESDGQMEMRLTETGLIAFTPPVESPDEPPPPQSFVFVSFDLPDRVVVKLSMGYAAIIVMHFVPTSEGSCRVETMVRSPLPFGPRLRFGRRENIITRQDRVIMESAQPWYDADGGAFERSVGADLTMLTARKVVELAEQGRWEEKRHSLPQRRVIALRA